MYQNLKLRLYRRPYLAAIISGFLWNFFLINAGILALASSAILIGFLIGLVRIRRWYDVFKQFPAAFGCYAVVVFIYLFIGEAFGLLRDLDTIATVLITVFTIPFLLVGEWIGWVLGPSNHLIDRPAAR